MTRPTHSRSSTASSRMSMMIRTTFKRSSAAGSEISLVSPISPLSPISPMTFPYVPRTIPIQYPSALPTASDPSVSRPPTLLDLPAEIRLQIYSYVFTPSSPRPPHSRLTESAPSKSDCVYTRARLVAIQADEDLTLGANTLQVCRQMYHECLPLLRRSVLVVPRLIDYNTASPFDEWISRAKTRTSAAMASSCHVRALPLDRTRLGKLDALALQRLCINELVVHEHAENLPTTSEATEWERTGSVVRVPLAVDTVYLQLCVCRCDQQQRHALPGTSDFARLRAGQVAGGVFAIFLSIQKVRRVVVYYCSVMRHGDGSEAVAQVQAMQQVFSEIVMERRSDQSDIWWTQPLDHLIQAGKPDGVTRYTMTFPEFEGRPSGSIQIEFYDSYSQTGAACVLA